MGKVAIVTDSNSGITQNQAKELGITVIPMPFMINGETYYEDISLSREDFYKKLEEDAEISTSQPTPGDVMKCWEEVLLTNDELVYLPMSSGLSSSYETAVMLAEDYNGKVHVANNQRISVTQRQAVLDALELSKKGKSAKEIKEYSEDVKYNSSIYIMVDTLKYLKKGGRITAAAAALGTFLKLKPVLQIQGEKLDAFAKARTLKQAKSIMIQAVKDDMEKRFEDDGTKHKVHLEIAHTENLEEAKIFKQEIQEELPGYDIYIDHLSLSVSCHIGPGSLAFAITEIM